MQCYFLTLLPIKISFFKNDPVVYLLIKGKEKQWYLINGMPFYGINLFYTVLCTSEELYICMHMVCVFLWFGVGQFYPIL